MKSITARKKRLEKASEKARDKRQERLWTGIVVTIFVSWILHEWNFDARQFSSGSTYYLLLWALPALLGILALLFWVRKEAAADWQKLLQGKMRLSDTLYAVILLPLAGAVAGIIFIALPADIIWDRVNWSHAQAAPAVREYVPIRSFSISKTKGRSRGYISVLIEGSKHSIPADPGFVQGYLGQDASRYRLWTERQPGMLGTFYIEDWDLQAKD
jgi:hypothetical protein